MTDPSNAPERARGGPLPGRVPLLNGRSGLGRSVTGLRRQVRARLKEHKRA